MNFKNIGCVLLLLVFGGISFQACYPDEKIQADPIVVEPSNEALDIKIQQNFLDPYNIAVRYRYVDRYVDPSKRVAPPKEEVVEPMLDFLTEYWIEPFINVENGETFFKNHVPAEVIFIGSSMYNADGTVTLGTADAGARITLTEVNFVDESNLNWVFRQLGTIYHEFAHIIHQRYNLPTNFQNISPQGYTSEGSWYALSDEEALIRGFVSPYGTSSFNEDYAEIVAYFLFDPEFYQKFINYEADCATAICQQRNEGRAKIRNKLNVILSHYERNTGVDLAQVRKLIQAKF
ncbi:MAG: putative zinc-binding metallopeptidase [Bacteroidota bacterium]|nr:putative zinc-binding metallopeptidase [Bacteroidota bacterium]